MHGKSSSTMNLDVFLEELYCAHPQKDPEGELSNTSNVCKGIQDLLTHFLSQEGRTYAERLKAVRNVIEIYTLLRPKFPNTDERAERCGKYLLIESARLVLEPEHDQLALEDEERKKFETSIQVISSQLAWTESGLQFMIIGWLGVNKWSHPVLDQLMRGEVENEESARAFLRSGEFPELLKLRVEMLAEAKCETYAINLADWCLKSETLEGDETLILWKLILLSKLGRQDDAVNMCMKIKCCDAVKFLQKLQSRTKPHEVAAFRCMAQTVMLQDWMKNPSCCAKKLLGFFMAAERQAEKNDNAAFLANIEKILQLTQDTTKMMLYLECLIKMSGDEFLEFCSEISLRIIRSDRHALDSARIYRKDADEAASSADRLTRACSLLAAVYAKHPQMKLSALLTCLYMDPKDNYFYMSKDIIMKLEEPLTNQPRGPSCVNEDVYAELLEMVDALRPATFHLIKGRKADWEMLANGWDSLKKVSIEHLEEAGYTYNEITQRFVLMTKQDKKLRKLKSRDRRKSSAAETSSIAESQASSEEIKSPIKPKIELARKYVCVVCCSDWVTQHVLNNHQRTVHPDYDFDADCQIDPKMAENVDSVIACVLNEQDTASVELLRDVTHKFDQAMKLGPYSSYDDAIDSVMVNVSVIDSNNTATSGANPPLVQNAQGSSLDQREHGEIKMSEDEIRSVFGDKYYEKNVACDRVAMNSYVKKKSIPAPSQSSPTNPKQSPPKAVPTHSRVPGSSQQPPTYQSATAIAHYKDPPKAAVQHVPPGHHQQVYDTGQALLASGKILPLVNGPLKAGQPGERSASPGRAFTDVTLDEVQQVLSSQDTNTRPTDEAALREIRNYLQQGVPAAGPNQNLNLPSQQQGISHQLLAAPSQHKSSSPRALQTVGPRASQSVTPNLPKTVPVGVVPSLPPGVAPTTPPKQQTRTKAGIIKKNKAKTAGSLTSPTVQTMIQQQQAVRHQQAVIQHQQVVLQNQAQQQVNIQATSVQQHPATQPVQHHQHETVQTAPQQATQSQPQQEQETQYQVQLPNGQFMAVPPQLAQLVKDVPGEVIQLENGEVWHVPEGQTLRLPDGRCITAKSGKPVHIVACQQAQEAAQPVPATVADTLSVVTGDQGVMYHGGQTVLTSAGQTIIQDINGQQIIQTAQDMLQNQVLLPGQAMSQTIVTNQLPTVGNVILDTGQACPVIPVSQVVAPFSNQTVNLPGTRVIQCPNGEFLQLQGGDPGVVSIVTEGVVQPTQTFNMAMPTNAQVINCTAQNQISTSNSMAIDNHLSMDPQLVQAVNDFVIGSQQQQTVTGVDLATTGFSNQIAAVVDNQGAQPANVTLQTATANSQQLTPDSSQTLIITKGTDANKSCAIPESNKQVLVRDSHGHFDAKGMNVDGLQRASNSAPNQPLYPQDDISESMLMETVLQEIMMGNLPKSSQLLLDQTQTSSQFSQSKTSTSETSGFIVPSAITSPARSPNKSLPRVSSQDLLRTPGSASRTSGDTSFEDSDCDSSTTNDDMFRCKFCGKGFETPTERMRHQRWICDKRAKNEEPPESYEVFQCEICKREAETERGLISHVNKGHDMRYADYKKLYCKEVEPVIEPKVKSPVGRTGFPCPYCEKHLSVKGSVMRHIKALHPEQLKKQGQTTNIPQVATNISPVVMSTSKSPTAMSTSKSPTAMSNSKSATAMSTNTSPKAIGANQSPMAIVTNQSPKAIVTNKSPMAIVTNTSPIAIDTHTSPAAIAIAKGPPDMVAEPAILLDKSPAVVPKPMLPISSHLEAPLQAHFVREEVSSQNAQTSEFPGQMELSNGPNTTAQEDMLLVQIIEETTVVTTEGFPEAVPACQPELQGRDITQSTHISQIQESTEQQPDIKSAPLTVEDNGVKPDQLTITDPSVGIATSSTTELPPGQTSPAVEIKDMAADDIHEENPTEDQEVDDELRSSSPHVPNGLTMPKCVVHLERLSTETIEQATTPVRTTPGRLTRASKSPAREDRKVYRRSRRVSTHSVGSGRSHPRYAESETDSEDETDYACEYCNEIFDNERELESHVNSKNCKAYSGSTDNYYIESDVRRRKLRRSRTPRRRSADSRSDSSQSSASAADRLFARRNARNETDDRMEEIVHDNVTMLERCTLKCSTEDCFEKFPTEKDWLTHSHLKNHHHRMVFKDYSCIICDKSFGIKSMCATHSRTCKPGNDLLSVISCYSCGKRFLTQSGFEQHLLSNKRCKDTHELSKNQPVVVLKGSSAIINSVEKRQLNPGMKTLESDTGSTQSPEQVVPRGTSLNESSGTILELPEQAVVSTTDQSKNVFSDPDSRIEKVAIPRISALRSEESFSPASQLSSPGQSSEFESTGDDSLSWLQHAPAVRVVTADVDEEFAQFATAPVVPQYQQFVDEEANDVDDDVVDGTVDEGVVEATKDAVHIKEGDGAVQEAKCLTESETFHEDDNSTEVPHEGPINEPTLLNEMLHSDHIELQERASIPIENSPVSVDIASPQVQADEPQNQSTLEAQNQGPTQLHQPQDETPLNYIKNITPTTETVEGEAIQENVLKAVIDDGVVEGVPCEELQNTTGSELCEPLIVSEASHKGDTASISQADEQTTAPEFSEDRQTSICETRENERAGAPLEDSLNDDKFYEDEEVEKDKTDYFGPYTEEEDFYMVNQDDEETSSTYSVDLVSIPAAPELQPNDTNSDSTQVARTMAESDPTDHTFLEMSTMVTNESNIVAENSSDIRDAPTGAESHEDTSHPNAVQNSPVVSKSNEDGEEHLTDLCVGEVNEPAEEECLQKEKADEESGMSMVATIVSSIGSMEAIQVLPPVDMLSAISHPMSTNTLPVEDERDENLATISQPTYDIEATLQEEYINTIPMKATLPQVDADVVDKTPLHVAELEPQVTIAAPCIDTDHSYFERHVAVPDIETAAEEQPNVEIPSETDHSYFEKHVIVSDFETAAEEQSEVEIPLDQPAKPEILQAPVSDFLTDFLNGPIVENKTFGEADSSLDGLPDMLQEKSETDININAQAELAHELVNEQTGNIKPALLPETISPVAEEMPDIRYSEMPPIEDQPENGNPNSQSITFSISSTEEHDQLAGFQRTTPTCIDEASMTSNPSEVTSIHREPEMLGHPPDGARDVENERQSFTAVEDETTAEEEPKVDASTNEIKDEQAASVVAEEILMPSEEIKVEDTADEAALVSPLQLPVPMPAKPATRRTPCYAPKEEDHFDIVPFHSCYQCDQEFEVDSQEEAAHSDSKCGKEAPCARTLKFRCRYCSEVVLRVKLDHHKLHCLGRKQTRSSSKALPTLPPSPNPSKSTKKSPPKTRKRRLQTAQPASSHMCHVCSRKYISPEALEKHISTHHGDEAEPNDKIMIESSSASDRVIYNCEKCDLPFPNLKTLQSHQEKACSTTGDIVDVLCTYCDLKFQTRRALLEHRAQSHPESAKDTIYLKMDDDRNNAWPKPSSEKQPVKKKLLKGEAASTSPSPINVKLQGKDSKESSMNILNSVDSDGHVNLVSDGVTTKYKPVETTDSNGRVFLLLKPISGNKSPKALNISVSPSSANSSPKAQLVDTEAMTSPDKVMKTPDISQRRLVKLGRKLEENIVGSGPVRSRLRSRKHSGEPVNSPMRAPASPVLKRETSPIQKRESLRSNSKSTPGRSRSMSPAVAQKKSPVNKTPTSIRQARSRLVVTPSGHSKLKPKKSTPAYNDDKPPTPIDAPVEIKEEFATPEATEVTLRDLELQAVRPASLNARDPSPASSSHDLENRLKFPCPHCSHSFTKEFSLEAHLVHSHGLIKQKVKSPLLCPLGCLERFSSHADIKCHMKWCHKIDNYCSEAQEDPDLDLRSDVKPVSDIHCACGEMIELNKADFALITEHPLSKSGRAKGIGTSELRQKLVEVKTECRRCSAQKIIWRCFDCNSFFTYRARLLKHMQQAHAGDEPCSRTTCHPTLKLKCHKCNVSFKSQKMLDSHMSGEHHRQSRGGLFEDMPEKRRDAPVPATDGMSAVKAGSESRGITSIKTDRTTSTSTAIPQPSTSGATDLFGPGENDFDPVKKWTAIKKYSRKRPAKAIKPRNVVEESEDEPADKIPCIQMAEMTEKETSSSKKSPEKNNQVMDDFDKIVLETKAASQSPVAIATATEIISEEEPIEMTDVKAIGENMEDDSALMTDTIATDENKDHTELDLANPTDTTIMEASQENTEPHLVEKTDQTATEENQENTDPTATDKSLEKTHVIATEENQKRPEVDLPENIDVTAAEERQENTQLDHDHQIGENEETPPTELLYSEMYTAGGGQEAATPSKPISSEICTDTVSVSPVAAPTRRSSRSVSSDNVQPSAGPEEVPRMTRTRRSRYSREPIKPKSRAKTVAESIPETPVEKTDRKKSVRKERQIIKEEPVDDSVKEEEEQKVLDKVTGDDENIPAPCDVKSDPDIDDNYMMVTEKVTGDVEAAVSRGRRSTRSSIDRESVNSDMSRASRETRGSSDKPTTKRPASRDSISSSSSKKSKVEAPKGKNNKRDQSAESTSSRRKSVDSSASSTDSIRASTRLGVAKSKLQTRTTSKSVSGKVHQWKKYSTVTQPAQTRQLPSNVKRDITSARSSSRKK